MKSKLNDRDIMPLGPHVGKRMFQVPVSWFEDFASVGHPDADPDVDAVLDYIQVNRRRLDKMLDDEEIYA